VSDYTDDYERLWSAYPARNGKKQGKKPGFAQWQRLTADEKRAAIADVEKRNRMGGWGKFIRDCERYLRHKGWEDEWTPERATATQPSRRMPDPPAYECDKWTALGNRLLFRYIRHARGLSEPDLAAAIATRENVVQRLSAALDEEIQDTGEQHDSVMTFAKVFLTDLDNLLHRRLRGRIIKGA